MRHVSNHVHTAPAWKAGPCFVVAIARNDCFCRTRFCHAPFHHGYVRPSSVPPDIESGGISGKNIAACSSTPTSPRKWNDSPNMKPKLAMLPEIRVSVSTLSIGNEPTDLQRHSPDRRTVSRTVNPGVASSLSAGREYGCRQSMMGR